MKRIFRAFSVLLAVSLSAIAIAQTTITPATHEVGAGTVPYQILVNSNEDWAASTVANWVTLSRTSGPREGNLLVTAAANTTGADRTATITVGGTTHILTQRVAGSGVQEVWAMGSDSYGQLGANASLSLYKIPNSVLSAGVASVAAGYDHSLIVKKDGSLWATGYNGYGQLGDGTTINRSTPVRILAGGVASVSAGTCHSLIVKTDGSLWGMGWNSSGQLGDGTTTSRLAPVQILASGVVSVSVGNHHNLIMKTDGSLWAMGYNYCGQLGDGTTINRLTPVQILASGVASVSEGGNHSLIVKTDGSLWAVGYNYSGALGDGTTINRLTPVQILASGVASVAAGNSHSLIVKTDGSLWAMGYNSSGALGDGTNTDRSTPVQILASGVASVAAGNDHSLIVKINGSLWAMGNNGCGQLGNGTSYGSWEPMQILTSGVASGSGGGYHSLIVKTDGSLWTTGENNYGQLGDGTTSVHSTPMQILGSVASISAGDDHSLIVKMDGSLWAAGNNYYGQLGDGSGTDSSTPVQVPVGSVASVSAGCWHSLVVKTDGSLWAMGRNYEGQLGDGTSYDSWEPVQILASEVASVAAGFCHSLIVKTDGSLWAMGKNIQGQLGDGTNTDRSTPVEILASGVASVAAGFYHSLIVKADGSLWATGQNSSYGQLGDGTKTNRSTPVQILASGVASVAAGFCHSLIVKTDGSLWAMGGNGYGQLGDGTNTNRSTPVQILASGVASVAAGNNHSMILKTDGSLWAMGSNAYGELGDGTTTQRSTPVLVARNVQKIAAGGDYSLIVASGDIGVPVPVVTNISPASGTTAGGTGVTITGKHFTGATSVTIGGSAANNVVVVSDTLITAVTLAGAAGTKDVVVTTPGGIGTGAGLFAYAAPPIIMSQPENQSVAEGALATFTVIASGNPVPTLRWQRNPLGAGDWCDLSNDAIYGGVTTGTLTVVTTLGMNTDTFRCVATNSVSATSTVAALTVGATASVPVIWTCPTNQSVTAGVTATFTAAASGNPTPTLRWQRNPLGSGSWSDLSNDATYGGVTTTSLTVVTTLGMNTDTFRCVATNSVFATNTAAATLTVSALAPPVVTVQPRSLGGVAGQPASIGVTATAASGYQWYKGGVAVSGAIGSSLNFPTISPADAGIYDVVLTGTGGSTLSAPVVLGIVPSAGNRTAGSVTTRTVWQDIHHPNGAIYDQFLLSGSAGTFTAGPGKIARCSFLDENDSIVQVEMSGAGAITIVLDNPAGPMPPALYNQIGIEYMKGKATIILAGADATTHFTIYSVGTFTNPGVTRADVPYAGWADVAVAGIVSTDGKLGGIHQGNANYNSTTGFTGIYAPTVTSVAGLAVVHDIAASGTAVPYMYFGTGGTVAIKIAGGDLAQVNTDSLTVGGIARVTMGAGQDSCRRAAPAQAIAGRLADDAGADVTASIVTGP